MPNIAEGFYWYTSVIYYQLSLSFVLFLAAFFFNYLNQQFLINKTFHLVITLFLLLIAVGMNETLALIIPFVCGAFFLSSLLSKNNNKWFFALLALVAIIGSALVVFSPGNAYRMAAYPDNKDMVTSLLMSFLQMGRFLAGFIFSFSGLFYFLFVACFFALSSSSLKQIKSHYLFIGFIVILFLSIFPAYYATGILGQHRTVNIATLFYVLLITLLALKLGKQLKERLPRKPQNMIIYFVLFFFIFGNGRTVALDIFSGRAVEYDAQLTKRSITLNEKKSTKINKLTIKPKSLFVIDVENDSTHWVNQAYVLDLD
jgi:MFS family permease